MPKGFQELLAGGPGPGLRGPQILARTGLFTRTRLTDWATTALPAFAWVVRVQVPAPSRALHVNVRLPEARAMEQRVTIRALSRVAKAKVVAARPPFVATCITLVAPVGTVPVVVTTLPRCVGARVSSGAITGLTGTTGLAPPLGAAAGAVGTTAAEGDDAGDVPAKLVAVTVNV